MLLVLNTFCAYCESNCHHYCYRYHYLYHYHYQHYHHLNFHIPTSSYDHEYFTFVLSTYSHLRNAKYSCLDLLPTDICLYMRLRHVAKHLLSIHSRCWIVIIIMVLKKVYFSCLYNIFLEWIYVSLFQNKRTDEWLTTHSNTVANSKRHNSPCGQIVRVWLEEFRSFFVMIKVELSFFFLSLFVIIYSSIHSLPPYTYKANANIFLKYHSPNW